MICFLKKHIKYGKSVKPSKNHFSSFSFFLIYPVQTPLRIREYSIKCIFLWFGQGFSSCYGTVSELNVLLVGKIKNEPVLCAAVTKKWQHKQFLASICLVLIGATKLLFAIVIFILITSLHSNNLHFWVECQVASVFWAVDVLNDK